MSTARRPFAHTGVVAAVVVLAAATACGSSSTKPAGSPAKVGPGSSTPPAAGAGTSAAAGTPLVVYSAQGYDGPVTKAFTKATGIPVKLVDDSTGPLLTKVAAEKNNPQWGLLWVDGDTAFAALDKQGQLLPYTATTALNAAGQALVPADRSYVPVSTTVMAALIYTAAKAPGVPRSYQDLLDPRYRALVGMNDPSQSGPTFPFVAGLMNQLGGQAGGVAAGKAYLNKLKANGLHVFPTNGDTLHALETGQISYGLIQSSAAAGEVVKVKKSAAFEPKVVYLPTTTLLPGVIGIDKAAPAAVQDEAKKFVEYVLSPAGQQAMLTGDASGDSLYWPVVDSVQANSALGVIPAHQKINPYFWGPQEGDINTFFDRAVK
jgi:iron(III) transport system substrate-binding protein